MRWLFALTCACGGSKHTDSAPETCEVYLTSDEAVGSGPWDGELLRFDSRRCDTDPLAEEEDVSLVMSDGTQVPVTLSGTCKGRRYTASDGLPAGEYVSVVLHDISLDEDESQDLSFELESPLTVAPFGQDPAFSATELEGRAFLLDPETAWDCNGLSGLLPDALPGRLWLQLGARAGEKINLSLVQEVEDQGQGCVYLQPQADLSATGELTWQTDHLVLNEDPAFDAWDVRLHLGLDATAEQAASVELTALVDVANLVAYNDTGSAEAWEHTCGLLASFGLSCQSCPESDRPSCVSLQFFAARAALSEQPWDLDTLPECGELLGYDTPEVDWPICEPACSATSPGDLPIALFGLLGLTLLRRREDRQRRPPA